MWTLDKPMASLSAAICPVASVAILLNSCQLFSDRREAWPRFVRKPHNAVVEVGGVVSFKCRVLAATPPTITWSVTVCHLT